MKTVEQIMQQLAESAGYKHWRALMYFSTFDEQIDYVERAMKIYARQWAKEAFKAGERYSLDAFSIEGFNEWSEKNNI